MTTDQWNKIEAIVDEALDIPEKERKAFIKKKCKGDQDLIGHALTFLSSVSKADQFFSSSYSIKDKLETEAAGCNLTFDNYKTFLGTKIGAYTLTSLLGKGGMGAVFLGQRTDGQFEHTAAIKIIQGGLSRPDIYDHFLRERQILAGLNHENIARLYDGGVTDSNIPYLVMEYVDGTPIDVYCDTHKLNTDERIRLFRSVCDAARYAHKNLVIHRDLKPENILITEDGSVKVMDFGIAKLNDSSKSKCSSEDPSSHYLSFSNASPEQLKNQSETTASDIYSLGTLLYKLLVGKHPLQIKETSSANLKELIFRQKPVSLYNRYLSVCPKEKNQIIENRSAKASDISEFLNEDLNSITQKCLEKSPEDRYQTVDDLIGDLNRYETGLPVNARSGGAAYRVKKFTHRNSAAIILAASFLVVAVASAFFYTYTVQKERDLAQMEADKATQVTQFVLNLFKGSDPSQTGGGDISARELLNRGIDRTEYLSNQPEIKANMLEVLGRILTQLGDYNEATNLLEQSISIRTDLFGMESLETVSSFEQMGTLLSAKGDLFKAESMLENALKLREERLGVRQSAMSEANAELAYVYRRLGKYDEAEKIYRSLIAIYENELGPDDPQTLRSLSSLGVTLHTSGRLEEAEIIYRDVLSKRLELYNTAHPDIAMSYNNLGSLLLNLGRFEESEEMISNSLQMRRALFGESHPKVALTMNNLGILKRNNGRFDEAITLIKQAMAINYELFGDEGLQTAVNLFSLAELHLMTGNYSDAFKHYQKSHLIFKEHLPEESSFIARSLIGMGESRIYNRDADPQLIRQQISSGFDRVKEIHPEHSIEFGLAAAALGKMYIMDNKAEQGIFYLNQAYNIVSGIEGANSVRAASIESLISGNYSHLLSMPDN